ncbi:hypothetical protein HOS57_gp30 [Streptomyces phage AbbeyMikolon]|uniref:Uncharacterized protein n=1 Tax=Streptomyces phage AbbeyMikolon TaxID=2059880 RepID=A0A2H5BLB6_9CAUD|nr:hypothetical protein HOS57_gp30 [Streptomyces phage AbbeyMikolon]AUG87102.1 hypothetical protein SEA_ABBEYMIKOLON_30 [Streptomyces phage AbbeyMikolon]
MSVPKISNAREFGETVAEALALAGPGGKDRLADLITALVVYTEDLGKLQAATSESVRRQEAVETAIKHVEKLATNARGYQDGTNLAAKTQAVAVFVNLLMGKPTTSRE